MNNHNTQNDGDNIITRASFRVYAERVIASKANFLSWCPTMDLLAVCLENLEIQAFRLSWQRVWAITSYTTADSSPCRFQWRPDGKVIAVGCSNGTINLHDVHDGNHLLTIRSSTMDSPLKFVDWGMQISHVSSKSYIQNQNIISERKPTNSKTSKKTRKEEAWRIAQNSFDEIDVIIASNSGGRLLMSLGNPFSLELKNRYIQHRDVLVQALSLSSDLSNVYLASIDSCTPPQLVIQYFQSDTLKSGWDEIRSIISQVSHIDRLSEDIMNAVNTIYDEWGSMRDISSSFLTDLQKELKDRESDPQSNAVLEYLNLINYGIPSETMNYFLLNTFTERHLKRWMTTLDGAYTKIQEIISGDLRPSLIRMLNQLRTLLGFSRCEEDENLGLSERTIHSSMMIVMSLLSYLHEVESSNASTMDSIRHFGIWLHAVFEMISPMEEPEEDENQMRFFDVRRIMGFISNPDPLAKFLTQQNNADISEFLPEVVYDQATPEYQRKVMLPRENDNQTTFGSFASSYLTSDSAKPFAYPLPYISYNSMKNESERPCIRTFVKALEERITKTIRAPVEAIGQSFSMKTTSMITNEETSKVCMRIIQGIPYVSFQTSDVIKIVKEENGNLYRAAIQVQSNEVVSIEFYDDESLCVLEQTKIRLIYLKSVSFEDTENPASPSYVFDERVRSFEANFTAAGMALNGRQGRNIGAVLATDFQRIKVIDFAEDDDDDDEEGNLMQE